MNSKFTCFLLLTTICAANAHIVKLKVHDESLTPIDNAEVFISFDNPRSPVRYDQQTEVTGEDGEVIFKGNGLLGASMRAKKKGYYPFAHYPGERFRASSKELDQGFSAELMLRSIRNPIPLFSKKITNPTPYRPYKIPVEGEVVGFDFLVGDWVNPDGEGEVADIQFCYEKEFVEFRKSNFPMDKLREENRMKYERQGKHWDEDVFKEEVGIWDSKLEVSFPGEKEGLIKIDDQFIIHSVLRMPHLAPGHGYESGYTEKKKTDPWDLARDDMGYFLRTRVKLDEDGEIESANYAKIYGEIEFIPTGYVYFHYYFNPTPNDRNLEFDTKRNLFGDDVEGSKVNLP